MGFAQKQLRYVGQNMATKPKEYTAPGMTERR